MEILRHLDMHFECAFIHFCKCKKVAVKNCNYFFIVEIFKDFIQISERFFDAKLPSPFR